MSLVDVTVQLLRETERAVCVSDDGKNEIWLPRSQIEMEKKRDDIYEVTLPEWLAKERGLI